MTRAMPQTIAHGLRERLGEFLAKQTRYADVESFDIKWFLREAAKLANADACSGSVAKAEIYHVCGDFKQALYWLENAERFRPEWQIDRARLIVHANLGFFSQAARWFREVAEPESVIFQPLFSLGLTVCSFDHMIAGASTAEGAQMELDKSALRVAEKGAAVLARNGVTESDLLSVVDVAGEVLRRHRLFWLDENPVIRSYSDDEGAGLLYQLKVGVSSSEAASLTDEVIELLIDRDIDVPGISFSFIPQQ